MPCWVGWAKPAWQTAHSKHCHVLLSATLVVLRAASMNACWPQSKEKFGVTVNARLLRNLTTRYSPINHCSFVLNSISLKIFLCSATQLLRKTTVLSTTYQLTKASSSQETGQQQQQCESGVFINILVRERVLFTGSCCRCAPLTREHECQNQNISQIVAVTRSAVGLCGLQVNNPTVLLDGRLHSMSPLAKGEPHLA